MVDLSAELPGSFARRSGARAFNVPAPAIPWLYLAPALLVLMVWTYIPLVEAFDLSFYQWNMLPTSKRTYVGFDNYWQLMILPEMQQALWNTLLYILGLFPL